MTDAGRTFCVCCHPDEINDATFRYVKIIRQGLGLAGYRDLGVSRDRKVLQASDLVVSISCLSAMRALIWRPRGRLLHWFQGIESVERRFLHRGWRGELRFVLWSAMEALLLRRAAFKMFVSEEMRSFMGDRDRSGSRSLVMPCYNADFDESVWGQNPERYSSLNLVYAGSLYPWQRVEDSLKAFEAVQRQRPDARLTVYTRETDRAWAMCQSLSLSNVQVESLTPEELSLALPQFSFGFILREEMPINHVSTPTKFSTYLAAGVVPVLTRATPALSRMLGESSFQVVIDLSDEHEEIARKILELSAKSPDEAAVRDAFRLVFQNCFNDELYAQQIADMVRGT